ncbi:hypothetical protein C8P63_11914 [Melghirimyces profundicolus]|uniref:Transglutaminase superfamily protein n=1 Tax=Melghirimyces profundicolus TaxID=1242148 RepID=A0A2T6BGX6_9BACL|nr:hypothetical protein [Melghirimyces profundicolus]PTX55307.1 hypothetical protein C8P63_11914 [Melghirimyces profundicolus]
MGSQDDPMMLRRPPGGAEQQRPGCGSEEPPTGEGPLSPFPEGLRFDIRPSGEISRCFRKLGVPDFPSAIRYVHRLPYGRNTDRSDYRLVLTEKKGTCSTKHALLARLAEEQDRPVHLMVGIYRMDGKNTPGVGVVLKKHRLSCLPEAHCYLKFRGHRLDATRVTEAGSDPFDFLLSERRIQPEGIGEPKVKWHQAYLREWVRTQGMKPEEWKRVWEAREACIRALEEI